MMKRNLLKQKKYLLSLFLTITIVGLCCGGGVFAQTVVKGKVTDHEDLPVAGASVKSVGARAGTSTASDGTFIFTAPADVQEVIVQAVGFAELKVPLGSGGDLNIVLHKKEDHISDMDEVVVVAYGKQKREAITGSVATISSKRLTDRVNTNLSQSLAGAAPGISATAGNGQPGSSAGLRIRGFGSVSASSSPLYVVDGVPYSGYISDINNNDIEDISILKDASATALYGARAANGVILIQTKKGRSAAPRFNLVFTSGSTKRGIPEYDRVSTLDYYPVMWEAIKNSLIYPSSGGQGLTPEEAAKKAAERVSEDLTYNPFNVENDKIVGVDGKLNPSARLLYDDFDWFSAVSQPGGRNEVSMSVSGNSGRSDYYVSLGYLREKGFVMKSFAERIAGRVQVNTQIKPWLKTGVNIAGILNNSSGPNAGAGTVVNPFNFARGIGPIYPVHAFDQNGKPVTDPVTGDQFFDYGLHPGAINRPSGAYPGRNIVYETILNDRLFARNSLTARTYAEVKFLKDFTFTTNASLDIINASQSYFQNRVVGDGLTAAGTSSKYYDLIRGITFNQLLNYTKKLNEHNIDVLVGHESYARDMSGLSGAKKLMVLDGNTELSNFVTLDGAGSYVDKYRTEGYFGRVNYDYKNKYFLSGSYRKDGSSRFSPTARWGDFYSIGASWLLSREEFMQTASGWLDVLKLRVSYGQVGNDDLLDGDEDSDYYKYQAFYSMGAAYNNGGEPGLLMRSLATPSLAWEVNNTLNLGLEFAILENRILGSVEVFKRGSSNLLFNVPLGLSSPVTTIARNIGTMWNKGLEIQLTGSIIRKQNFDWLLETNFTTLKNEITKLPAETPEITSGTKKLMVGKDIYAFWLRRWYGVDPTDGAGLYYIDPEKAEDTPDKDKRTINGALLTTDHTKSEYAYAGSAIPKFFGSFTNTLRYKGFSFSVLLNYQVGGRFYDAEYARLMSPGYGSALHADVLNSWKQPGDKADIPRLDMDSRAFFNAASDRWLIDASYLNIRTATASYVLPKEWLQNLTGMESVKVYVSGENLLMLSRRKGLNPTESFSGTNGATYVSNRIISAGLNITF